MDVLCGDGSCLLQSAMNDPVNKAMIQAVDATLKADTELLEASVGAQVGEVAAPIADMGMGQLLNVQA